MALNTDGLEANAPVSREEHWRVYFEYARADMMVKRNDAPDMATALATIRGEAA